MGLTSRLLGDEGSGATGKNAVSRARCVHQRLAGSEDYVCHVRFHVISHQSWIVAVFQPIGFLRSQLVTSHIHQTTSLRPTLWEPLNKTARQNKMFSSRILRAAPRFVRAPAQRRLMSAVPESGAKGTENAFVRERQHVKEHAAATTGMGSW